MVRVALACGLLIALLSACVAIDDGEADYDRVDRRAADLLSEGAIWDAPEIPSERAPARRYSVTPTRGLVLRENTVFVFQYPGGTHGRIRLRLEGRPHGAPTEVTAFTMYRALPNLPRQPAAPPELAANLHRQLLSETWVIGNGRFESSAVVGDPNATYTVVGIRVPAAAELELDRVVVEELLPIVTTSRLVGGEVRPARPVESGSDHDFLLPPLAAGSDVELGLAVPEGMQRIESPLEATVECAGADPPLQTLHFTDSAPDLLVRRWSDLRLHFTRAQTTASTLRISVRGGENTALFVTPPTLLAPRDRATGRNVILFSIDTLRADAVGAWGSTSGATPNLDRFAAGCVRFSRATSPANFTIPAHGSMMTGLQPYVHGAYRYGDRVSIRPWPNLAGALADAGCFTAAFTSGGYVDAAFGFDRGFDRYRMLDPLMTPANPRYARSPRKRTPEYNEALRSRVSFDEVTDFVERHAQNRFFLFLHTYHAHDYSPAAETAARFGVADEAAWKKPIDLDPADYPAVAAGTPQLDHYRRLYAATISEVDAAFGRLLETLEKSGLQDETIVLVTADHGEAFREHDTLFHTVGLHDEVLHVPLLLRVPGVAPAVIDRPVSLVDLAPTLLELAGAAPLPEIQGQSLVPLLHGGDLPDAPLLSQDGVSGGPLHSALTFGRFRYLRIMKPVGDAAATRAPAAVIATDTDESDVAAPAAHDIAQELAAEHLYDVVADPGELHDLVGDPAHATTLAQARVALDRKLAQIALAAEAAATRRKQRIEANPDLSDELRALGYE